MLTRDCRELRQTYEIGDYICTIALCHGMLPRCSLIPPSRSVLPLKKQKKQTKLVTDRDHNCCSSIKQICNQSRREDERGGARHLTQFTFSFIFFFGGNSTADFFFFFNYYFSFDVYILSNLLGVFWGPECCQEESGETPPHFEGTGMIQRGSSGGRGSSGSSSLT